MNDSLDAVLAIVPPTRAARSSTDGVMQRLERTDAPVRYALSMVPEGAERSKRNLEKFLVATATGDTRHRFIGVLPFSDAQAGSFTDQEGEEPRAAERSQDRYDDAVRALTNAVAAEFAPVEIERRERQEARKQERETRRAQRGPSIFERLFHPQEPTL